MKTDDEIQRDVMDELAWEPSVDHSHVGVSVRDGVVAITGRVSSFLEKLAAEKAVRRVAGVRAIAEEIQVRYPREKKSGDDEIAKRVCDILEWDALVPDGAVEVKVEKGWVTLTGRVRWRYQSEAARNAAARITGVTGISNLLEIEPEPTNGDVRERIQAAFRRHAELDANAITVWTDGGTVRLGGRVHAWREREIAERAAWAAPGVTRIEDNIIVS